MIGQSTRIGRVFGVDLRIDWSWIFIFILLTWNLFAVFTVWHPNWTPAGIFAMALTASLLFFGCILLHELAHTVVAKAQGTHVRSITLFLFGGVSDIEREPRSPKEEFLTAIVGPITSIALGVVFLAVASVATATPMGTAATAWEGFARLSPLGTLLAWLGPINIMIGLFNLLPAFPLDGGRVLRSILWAINRDLGKATRSASMIGATIGWLLVLAGIGMTFGLYVPFFGTGFGNGLWLAFIGWFIAMAANQANARLALDEALSGITVAQLMQQSIPTVSTDMNLGMVVKDYFMRSSDRAVAVVDGDQFSGLLCIADIRDVPPDQWNSMTAADVMRSADALATTSPDRPLTEAFEQMARRDIDQLPVLENARLVGMLRRKDVTRWLELAWRPAAQRRTESGVTGRPRPRTGPTSHRHEPFVRPI
jgi:Zn-dependent protease